MGSVISADTVRLTLAPPASAGELYKAHPPALDLLGKSCRRKCVLAYGAKGCMANFCDKQVE
jgi:hypothetical protein